MVKAYLRYKHTQHLNLVVSHGANVALAPPHTAFAPALHAVHAYHIHTAHITKTYAPTDLPLNAAPAVTALALDATADTLAVGYADGSVRLWDLPPQQQAAASDAAESPAERVVLTGHRSAVLSLRFSPDGSTLVTGGADTVVVLWDVVGECGICKLRGHRGAVTGVQPLPSLGAIASVSKDGTLRLWDVETRHCVQSAAAPSGELWSLDAVESLGRLLTGGAGGELLVWSVGLAEVDGGVAESTDAEATVKGGDVDSTAEEIGGSGGVQASGPPAAARRATGRWMAARATLEGSIASTVASSAVRMQHSPDGNSLAVQHADKRLQLFAVHDGEQRLRRAARRREEKSKKRHKASLAKLAPEAAAEAEGGGEDEDGAAGPGAMESAHVAAFEAACLLRGSHKLHSFALLPPVAKSHSEAEVRLLVAQRDNSLTVWVCNLASHEASPLASPFAAAGHRNEPRSLALSPDDRTLASVADGEAKLWALGSGQCVSTVACGYGLCVTFCLDGTALAVGTKEGALRLYAVATGDVMDEMVDAHSDAIWSVCTRPGGDGGSSRLLTASADHNICLWRLEPRAHGAATLAREQVHDVGDDAMGARYSADGRIIAVALLDASVKVLFADTLRLSLTLFGHSLPVLAVALSSDGTLVATGSADKTLKVWGLDFGDCHRSLRAHAEPVMAVEWVRDTHYVFTASKDKTIKYWDCDSFDLIHVLRAHHAEVWSIALSRAGSFLVSASRDRSLRVWRRTDEQVFLEEEREAELEGSLDASLLKQQQTAEAEEDEALALNLDGRGEVEASSAGRRTLEAVKGAERLLEALKVLDDEEERIAELDAALRRWTESGGEASGAKRPVLAPNLLLLGLAPDAYLLRALGELRTAELEQALLLLPFEQVRSLLSRLVPLLATAAPVELMARCVLYLLRVHHKAILAQRSMSELVAQLGQKLIERLSGERDRLGFNRAALAYLQHAGETVAKEPFESRDAAAAQASDEATITELRRSTVAREKRGAGAKRTRRTTRSSKSADGADS